MRMYAGTRSRLLHRPIYMGLSAPVGFSHGGLGLPFWLGFFSFFLLVWRLLR
jgi:hypothetical protein